uniref:Testis expressed 26 n=1 Tax=Gopherus evgoodei TaxID=1825980 RepID=A0A8C4VKK0_9SAUR
MFLGDKIMWDPYETTMKHEYPYRAPINANSSASFVFVIDPIGFNTYREEFCWKPYFKAEPIMTGSSSGTRRNNPHPSQVRNAIAFSLIYEKPQPISSLSPWTQPISKQEVGEAIRAQFNSTYNGDYLGLPQGLQIKDTIPVPPDWKKIISHPLATEFRHHYQAPARIHDFMDFSWKYGCNANRHIPAKGVVPTVTFSHIQNQENIKQMTTYQRDFGKEYLNIISVLNSLDPEQVNKYIERRAILQHFLNTVCGSQSEKFRRTSPSRTRRQTI